MNDRELETAALLIDAPQEDFERDIERENLNIGQTSNLIVYLEGQYMRLTAMANDLTALVTKGVRKNDDPAITDTLTSIYAALMRVELKVTYLKKRREKLFPLD